MMYLIMNMWTKVPNKEDAGIGTVMAGLNGAGKHRRAHCYWATGTVKRALRWLEEKAGSERAYTPGGREDRSRRCSWTAGRHRDRERGYDGEVAIEKVMEGGSPSDHLGGGPSEPPEG